MLFDPKHIEQSGLLQTYDELTRFLPDDTKLFSPTPDEGHPVEKECVAIARDRYHKLKNSRRRYHDVHRYITNIFFANAMRVPYALNHRQQRIVSEKTRSRFYPEHYKHALNDDNTFKHAAFKSVRIVDFNAIDERRAVNIIRRMFSLYNYRLDPTAKKRDTTRTIASEIYKNLKGVCEKFGMKSEMRTLEITGFHHYHTSNLFLSILAPAAEKHLTIMPRFTQSNDGFKETSRSNDGCNTVLADEHSVLYVPSITLLRVTLMTIYGRAAIKLMAYLTDKNGISEADVAKLHTEDTHPMGMPFAGSSFSLERGDGSFTDDFSFQLHDAVFHTDLLSKLKFHMGEVYPASPARPGILTYLYRVYCCLPEVVSIQSELHFILSTISDTVDSNQLLSIKFISIAAQEMRNFLTDGTLDQVLPFYANMLEFTKQNCVLIHFYRCLIHAHLIVYRATYVGQDKVFEDAAKAEKFDVIIKFYLIRFFRCTIQRDPALFEEIRYAQLTLKKDATHDESEEPINKFNEMWLTCCQQSADSMGMTPSQLG
tara:strand:+ start:24080 stop:25702 length:1623 start_codon:yes stop_codon:yes gene_type:complete